MSIARARAGKTSSSERLTHAGKVSFPERRACAGKAFLPSRRALTHALGRCNRA